jgi:asparagine N-glycosylation enzyme membrane subunit Stt3
MMAVGVTKNVGMLLLAIWLIVSGLAGLTAIGLPPLIMPVLALLAGILILIGR